MPRVLLISRRIGRPENQLSSGARDKSVDGPLRRGIKIHVRAASAAVEIIKQAVNLARAERRRLAYSFGSDSAGTKNAQFYRHQANKSATLVLAPRALANNSEQHEIYANSARGDRIHLNKLALGAQTN